MITIYQIKASKVSSVYHICSEKVCDLLCTSSTHFEVKSKSTSRCCFISFNYIYNIWKKLKVMRKLVKLKAKWRSLEMHQNDGVWVVLSLSQSPLLSLSRVRPARYVATGNESTHLGVAAIFQSYLCSLFRWLNFFIKHALGAVGWGRRRVKYRLPVPVRLQYSSSSASLLLYGRPHCGAVGGPRCTFAASRFPSHLV